MKRNKKIRVWKLGDHTQGILPTVETTQRLMDIVKTINSPYAIDIFWDSMIDVIEIKDGKANKEVDFVIINKDDLAKIEQGELTVQDVKNRILPRYEL